MRIPVFNRRVRSVSSGGLPKATPESLNMQLYQEMSPAIGWQPCHVRVHQFGSWVEGQLVIIDRTMRSVL
jgi:hypothetical protein